MQDRRPSSGPMMSGRDSLLSRAALWVASEYCIAFSSEVDSGSREENASKQRMEPGSDTIRTDKAPGDAP
jgi:hypothetical protein